MITADQIICHCVGDYLLQSDYMAAGKIRDWRIAAVHALFYSLPFLLLSPSLTAWLVMVITHTLIDRFRLARYVVWAKNFIAPRGSNPPWLECQFTGYPPDRPAWMAVWLMIIGDNIIHILVNALALRYL